MAATRWETPGPGFLFGCPGFGNASEGRGGGIVGGTVVPASGPPTGFRALLEDSGLQVGEAEDGAPALAAVRRRAPDVVLSDPAHDRHGRHREGWPH